MREFRYGSEVGPQAQLILVSLKIYPHEKLVKKKSAIVRQGTLITHELGVEAAKKIGVDNQLFSNFMKDIFYLYILIMKYTKKHIF